MTCTSKGCRSRYIRELRLKDEACRGGREEAQHMNDEIKQMDIRISDQYSAIIDLEICGDKVQLCFCKEEKAELRQRILRCLTEAYESRIKGQL